MAKRKESYPLQKVTLNLRDGDWDWLRTMHGRAGASKVIREMVMGHVERSRNAAQQRHLPMPATVIPADIIEGVKDE